MIYEYGVVRAVFFLVAVGYELRIVDDIMEIGGKFRIIEWVIGKVAGVYHCLYGIDKSLLGLLFVGIESAYDARSEISLAERVDCVLGLIYGLEIAHHE